MKIVNKRIAIKQQITTIKSYPQIVFPRILESYS